MFQVIPKEFPIENKNVVHKKGGHYCHQSNSITYILQMQVKNQFSKHNYLVNCGFGTPITAPKFNLYPTPIVYRNIEQQVCSLKLSAGLKIL
jgi:hypothetical protein